MGQPTTFTSSGGEQCYLLPTGVTSVHVEATGATGGGADSSSGLAAIETADASLPASVVSEASPTLYVEVGGTPPAGSQSSGTPGGFNGGRCWKLRRDSRGWWWRCVGRTDLFDGVDVRMRSHA